MMNENFEELLKKAVNNESNAVEQIVDLYMPLILKYSYLNGKIDEDLRQEIVLKVIKSLSKFNLKVIFLK